MSEYQKVVAVGLVVRIVLIGMIIALAIVNGTGW